MTNQEPVMGIDLLVHPFYTISKVYSRTIIDEQSERNILAMKSLWFDSISDIAKNERRCLVLVNGTNIQDWTVSTDESANPYRLLYREIISHSRQFLGKRLFYFFPKIHPNSFSTTTLDDRFILARASDSAIVYEPTTVKVTAYGEHVDEVTKAGCVDSSIRDLTTALKIPPENVRTDPDKSLPLQPLVRTEYGYDVPTTLYLTVSMIRNLSK